MSSEDLSVSETFSSARMTDMGDWYLAIVLAARLLDAGPHS